MAAGRGMNDFLQNQKTCKKTKQKKQPKQIAKTKNSRFLKSIFSD
jgi:hypothetical protein